MFDLCNQVIFFLGIGRKHIMGEFKALFKILLDIDSNFYPESMHRMLLINVPFIFKVLLGCYFLPSSVFTANPRNVAFFLHSILR